MTEGEAAPGASGARTLMLRIAAALVLAPVAIAITYLGGWPWTVLVTLGAIGLYAEWLGIVGEVRRFPVLASGVAALALAGIAPALGHFEISLAALVLGLIAVAALTPDRPIWTAAGFAYAVAAEQASILLRSDPAMGWTALMLVFLVVWVTDIGGYIAGRGIGGPKLWPRVSPNKTWAGAIGGFAASLAVAGAFAALDLGKAGPLLMISGVLSGVSQLGDLFESAVKRRFGVKDSSHVIPGHGGLLDRLDGFVAAVVFAAIFGLLRAGVDGVGRGLMVW